MSRISTSAAFPLRLLIAGALVVALVAAMITQTSASASGYGELRVTTSPTVDTEIRVDGEARNRSQLTGLTLTEGDHQVCFSGAAGHISPGCQTVTITSDETTELTGRFEPAGRLHVTTEPADLGVAISVDGQRRDRDAVQLPMAVGSHKVCFESITGYATPDCEMVDITAGTTLAVVGEFATVDGAEPGDPDIGDPDEPSDPTPAPGTSCKKGKGKAHAFSGDWNGSGSDGLGWWCDGKVKLRTADGAVKTFSYGRTGDVPLVADWDGDGVDTVSVVRDGTWHVNDRLTDGPASSTFDYGRVARGDTPIAGAWNGHGGDLPGIIRDREWHLRHLVAAGNADRHFVFGRLHAGDLPLWGDWRGTGGDAAGIIRGGEWHLRNQHTGGPADTSYVYGRVAGGDVPLVGDWNGDGVDTPAIVRDGTWYLKHEHGDGHADQTISFPSP